MPISIHDTAKRRIIQEAETLAGRAEWLERENRRLKSDLANSLAHARRMEQGRHAAEANLKAAGLLGSSSGDAPALSREGGGGNG